MHNLTLVSQLMGGGSWIFGTLVSTGGFGFNLLSKSLTHALESGSRVIGVLDCKKDHSVTQSKVGW